MLRIGMGELIVILLIVLILFGASRLPEIAGALAKSVKEFRKVIKDVKESVEDVDKDKGIKG